MGKTYNIYNMDAVQEYLNGFCHDAHENVEQPLADYLIIAIGKALAKEPSCIEPVTSLPGDAPEWMVDKWHQGQNDFHRFVGNDQLNDQINHIKDWIKGAIVSEHDWITDLDTKGRPKRLVQISSLKRAMNTANKDMKKLAAQFNQMVEGDENTKVIERYDNGYTMVQLLTPQALDFESGKMGHCVGQGGYDDALENGTIEIYSLRDKKNRPHATLEVIVKEHSLRQCKGKENKPPVSKYMPPIQSFLKKRKYKLTERASHTGLIEQDGIYYDIHNLPKNLHWKKNLNLESTQITTLPKGLRVVGYIDLHGTQITTLPEGLQVGGNLYLNGTKITYLPEGLQVGENLILAGTPITALPDDLEVGGMILLPNKEIFASVEEARKRMAELYPEQNKQKPNTQKPVPKQALG